MQFSLYEKLICRFKRQMPSPEYERKEFVLNMIAGGMAGAVAAACTNPLEVITVTKQTNPELKLTELVR